MARLFYYGTIILALVGLGVSLLIFPRDDEVAFLQYKDQRYSNALVLYEVQIEKGNYSPQVVTPLADLYLKYGYVDKAINLMEVFVKKNPNYLDAWKKLGIYYQYDQRHDDYLRNLEAIYLMAPSSEILRQLSEIHNFNGDLGRQKKVLKELTARFPAKKKDYIDLAYLYAAERDYASAVSTLERQVKHEKVPDPEMIELIMSLLIDAGQPKKAFEIAASSAKKSDELAVLRYTYRLHTRGEVKLAYQLLEPYQEQSENRTEIFEALVVLDIARDNKETAFNRLSEWFDQNRLPVQMVETFLILLIERNDIQRLKGVIRVAQLDLINQHSLLRLIDIFLQAGDAASVQVIHQRFNEDLRSEYPVVKIKLALATGQSNISKEVISARKHPLMTDEKRLQLAQIYTLGHLNDEAHDILADVKSIENVVAVDLYDISNLYIKHGMAEQGFRLISQQRLKKRKTDKSESPLEINSVILAMAAGREKQVLNYLKNSKKPDVRLLTDLYYMAESSNNINILLKVSRLLIQNSPKSDSQYMGFRIDALLAAKRYSETLPYLRLLVMKNHQNWIYVYADVLEKLDLQSEWVAFWVAQSKREALSRKEKRSIAYALLEKRYWAEAQDIFQQLSEKQRPDDSDVNQLIFLWDRYFVISGLEWLSGRIISSDSAEKSQWFQKYYQLAIALEQEPSIEVFVNQHPEYIDQLTELEAENNQQKRAYIRLIKWYKRGKLLPASLVLLLNLAIEYHDKSVLNQLVVEVKTTEFELNVLVNMFDLILDRLSVSEIQNYRGVLGEDFLKKNRVIGFMFDAAEKKTVNHFLLVRVSKDAVIHSSQRLLLAGFLLKHGLKKESEIILNSIQNPELLREDEKITMANLYLELGRPEVALKLFVHQRGLMKGKAKISTTQTNSIYLLLATAAGRKKEVLAYIQQKATDRQLLTDLFYVAMDFNRPRIALEASSKLYQIHPDFQTLSLKTRALLRNGQYQEASTGLKKLFQQNPQEWEFVYIDSLERSGNKEQLRDFWKQKSVDLKTSMRKKGEIAFILLEKGFRKDAENLFFKIAESSKADSHAVKQLLYLWGARPRPYALAWLENRLREASVRDQAGWLNILVGVGQQDMVIRFITRNQVSATSEMIDVMLGIFVIQQDKTRFKEIVSYEISKEDRVPRLIKIAQWSAQLGLAEISMSAYEKGVRLDPENREILNEYGKLAFYQEKYDKSEALLKKFIQQGGLDRISMFLYAEILWRKKETGEAKIYYQKALDLMSILIRKQVSDRTLEAKIKYQLGEREDALKLLRGLQKQYPGNTVIKADFIELLLEMGYTEEAEMLLADF